MDQAVDGAVERLLSVRRGGAKLAGLGDAAPADEAGAWAVQRAVLAGMGDTVGGYKCAWPTGKSPGGATLPARGLVPSPARHAADGSGQVGIETEIAFRFARDLPPREAPYTRAEVEDAIGAALPVIEMVESRYADMKGVSALEAAADHMAHGALVLGAEVADWRGRDLSRLVVRQTCDGAVQVEKAGGNPAGDPMIPVVWLANALPRHGLHLRAGDVVTTGSCTGMLFVPRGARVTGAFEGFGAPVEVEVV